MIDSLLFSVLISPPTVFKGQPTNIKTESAEEVLKSGCISGRMDADNQAEAAVQRNGLGVVFGLRTRLYLRPKMT